MLVPAKTSLSFQPGLTFSNSAQILRQIFYIWNQSGGDPTENQKFFSPIVNKNHLTQYTFRNLKVQNKYFVVKQYHPLPCVKAKLMRNEHWTTTICQGNIFVQNIVPQTLIYWCRGTAPTRSFSQYTFSVNQDNYQGKLCN